MRVLLQRSGPASVTISDETVGSIEKGYVLLAGYEADDEAADIEWCCGKIMKLRLFDGPDGRMSRDIIAAGGELLLISQFTLHASIKKGTRPSFHRSAPPEQAEVLYRKTVCRLEELIGRPIAQGRFGAMMKVSLVNDGPVTLWIDSRKRE